MIIKKGCPKRQPFFIAFPEYELKNIATKSLKRQDTLSLIDFEYYFS
jgi:hypothetical protein